MQVDRAKTETQEKKYYDLLFMFGHHGREIK